VEVVFYSNDEGRGELGIEFRVDLCLSESTRLFTTVETLHIVGAFTLAFTLHSNGQAPILRTWPMYLVLALCKLAFVATRTTRVVHPDPYLVAYPWLYPPSAIYVIWLICSRRA
jgi:hypothetical protein